MKITRILTLLLPVLMCLSSCEFDDEPGTTQFTVRLTDYPSEYEALYVDIQDVQINYTTDREEGWQSLEHVNKGVYNVLEYFAGKDTVLATGKVAAGKIQQLRVVYGPTHTVQVNGELKQLLINSNFNLAKDIIFPVQFNLKEGLNFELTLDFDASKSVFTYEDETALFFIPTTRLYNKGTLGTIRGKIVPAARHYVYSRRGNATISTYTDAEGVFEIGGIEEGIYDVIVSGLCDGYAEVDGEKVESEGVLQRVVEDVEVGAEEVVDIGEIYFSLHAEGN